MGKSTVYFAANGGTNWAESRVAKAKELFYLAGFDKKIKPGDDVAIKIHFGEWNRSACLRPEDVASLWKKSRHAAVNRLFVTPPR